MRTIFAFTITVGALLALAGCATSSSTAQKPERGPDGTIAYMVQVETSEPRARIEANGDYVGKSPTTLKIFGDKDGTFHNFGSYEYEVKAYPVRQGQYIQTKVFRTGGLFRPEDRIPSRLYFDMDAEPSSAPTSYHSTGLTGGYDDTVLAPDRYRVVFRGNDTTEPERAQDLACLRASELTLQHGFTCFAIIKEDNSEKVSSTNTLGHIDTTASGSRYSSGSGNVYINPYGYSGNYSGRSSSFANAHTTVTLPQTYTFYSPKTGILVQAFEKKPDGIFTYDAAFLQQSLKQKYRLK